MVNIILSLMTPEDLKTWRKKNGYTQPLLSQALGVHPVSISRWEIGVREIPPFLALALRALELEGGERKPRDTKTKKEVADHGKRLPKK
jgi:transcriptional regulator with XRE-family HTH domain